MSTVAVISIGVLSDTHGLLRPALLPLLRGCDLLIHAGDIGEEVWRRLKGSHRLVAVRGNTDRGEWAAGLRRVERVELGGKRILVVHDLKDLPAGPDGGPGADVVIHGHSHRPLAETRGGVLYLNPGSAGPRRFDLPVSAAILRVGKGGLRPRLVALE